MTKCFLFFAVFFFCAQTGAFAQKNWGGGVDNEDFHFGFNFQYVSAEYKVLKKADWRGPFNDPDVANSGNLFLIDDQLNSISSPTSPGFGLGFVTNLRVGNNADLRFTPALVFSDRLIDYEFADSLNFRQQKVQSTLVDFPLGVKLKSDRRKNFRAYLITGVKYSIDIASKKKSDNTGLEPKEKFVQNTKNIIWYEAGIGLDLYFEFFKLSPEIKFSQSVNSVLDDKDRLENPYTAPLDKLFLRNLQFSLYFE